MKTDFIRLETVSSTNTWAKEHASEFDPLRLTCIVAGEQTAGRGRQEKRWVSPRGSNLYVTLYFTVPEQAPYMSNLGQIMALACAELLQDLKVPAQIKWPNDLVCDKKKIGGVLTETVSRPGHVGVIVGLGLNVNMPEAILATINQPATSLHLMLQKHVEPGSLLEPLLKWFTAYLARLQSEGFAPLQKRFLELLAYQGESITVHLPHKTIVGVCDSITSEGRLKLRLASGKFLTLSAGEVVG
jgi:BirA family biotin operon repressor/biotin-[acetyl-CoA-carboxylase] ligase